MGFPGYVYVLINPAMPGLVKVGRTARDPEERAAELSASTGVATPFIVVYHDYFLDAEDAEKHLHTLLELGGHRLSANREFFSASVPDVLQAINKVPGRCSPGHLTEKIHGDDLISTDPNDALSEFKLSGYRQLTAADELLIDAEDHYYGSGDTIQDFSEAMKLFRQAAKLGSTVAFIYIGEMYKLGEGVKIDLSKALDYHKEAVRRGNFSGYGFMASLFAEQNHLENASKAWKKYFEGLQLQMNETFGSIDSPPSIIFYHYLVRNEVTSNMGRLALVNDREAMSYASSMRPFKDQLVILSESYIDYLTARNSPAKNKAEFIREWLLANL